MSMSDVKYAKAHKKNGRKLRSYLKFVRKYLVWSFQYSIARYHLMSEGGQQQSYDE